MHRTMVPWAVRPLPKASALELRQEIFLGPGLVENYTMAIHVLTSHRRLFSPVVRALNGRC